MTASLLQRRLGWREPLEGRTHGQRQPRHGPDLGTDSETILHLQRAAGNSAVAGLMTGITSVTDLMRAGERLLAEQIEAGARATENHLTNELFWLEYPSLRDEKLQAGTPEAIRWIRIRDTVVHPLLAARAKSAPSTGWNPPPGKSGPPAGTVPAAQIAAGSGGGSGSAQASLDDKYFLQDTGHYQDVSDDKGQTRVWMYGSSGMNICNMTTLTMGLVSMAGESEVRSKIIALLKSKGMHGGASVKIGKEWVPLATALDDPKVVDQIGLLDLVTAAAIGEHGNYGDVSLPGTIARVARDTGLAIKSDTIRGQPRLATEKGRTMAQEMLAAGKRVIAGTINHYVYLIEVNDDSVLLHDPAGARVEPSLKAPVFLHSGSANGIAGEWSRLDDGRKEVGERRVSTNPAAAAVVGRLREIEGMDDSERKKATAHIGKDHPGHIDTGARNFYASSEYAAHDLRLCVSLST